MKLALRIRARICRCAQTVGVSLFMSVLGECLSLLCQKDSRARKEFELMKEGQSYGIRCHGAKPTLFLEKRPEGLVRLPNRQVLRLLPSWQDSDKVSLYSLPQVQQPRCLMTIKSLALAWRLFSGRMSLAQAYASHSFSAKGGVDEVMQFSRLVNLALAYLFPPFITKNLMTHRPRLQCSPLWLYARIFGRLIRKSISSYFSL